MHQLAILVRRPLVYFCGMIAAFMAYWSNYASLEERHERWLNIHAMPLSLVPEDWPLFNVQARDDYVFVVMNGLLGGVTWDDAGHRSIHLLATPFYNFMTTRNFYTAKRVPYQIVALRESAVLRLPVNGLKAFKETDAAAATLVSVLREKHNKQYLLHNALLQIRSEGERYRAFERYCREWLALLALQEIADYLAMSLSSVSRARRGDI